MSAETHTPVTGTENTEPDNVNVGLIATVTIVGAVLVLSIALALTALVRSETATFSNEIGAYGNLGTVKRLKAEQRAKLEASPAWADKAAGQVALPIDRAMLAVTTEIQKDPTRATAPAPAGSAPAAAAPAAAPEGTTAAAAPAAPAEKVGKDAAATEKTAQTRAPASQP